MDGDGEEQCTMQCAPSAHLVGGWGAMVRGFLAILVACEIRVMKIYYARISDIAMNSWAGDFLAI